MLCPVCGQTKPITYSHSYFVCLTARGREPFNAHTLVIVSCWPKRASSVNHDSIFLSGCSDWTLSSVLGKFFKIPPEPEDLHFRAVDEDKDKKTGADAISGIRPTGNNLHKIGTLILGVYVDDGCVVWINGTEVARLYVSGGFKAYNTTRTKKP